MMKYIASNIQLFITAFTSIYIQKMVSGRVVHKITKEGTPAVSAIVNGRKEGAYTNDKGYFHFSTARPWPFTISVSTIGFSGKEISVMAANYVTFFELEFPVKIELIGSKQIIISSHPNYFDMKWYPKGVDLTTSSLIFTTITTRDSIRAETARSSIKLGTTCLTNKYYQNSFGKPDIGGMYFESFTRNVF
ncbi:carboxypeptidase-like regulatory domain-containing protein [Flavihumibacter fluvii]|uniref:carboxypeptidase-like regulatory domain-containing protein n=1 Tax=Flavihumibacter fluvii TaxID=2838157 RepID=UPI001BDDFBAD|nr:carboxypeptidase-like regulatory domain-containing protein [Flavihumibacter fluvii]ULQ54463.1 carboxypeptidase-like regulatory domain-containing protein [Flavihumibacter fluvii]